MAYSLPEALGILKRHEPELRQCGVVSAAVFGSVARGEAGATSDLDVMVELDESKALDLFDYVNVKLSIAEMFETTSLDAVNRATLKPQLRPNILREAVRAF